MNDEVNTLLKTNSMYKYNPEDFSEDIARDMRRVYKLYEEQSDELAWAIDDLYYSLKNLRTYKIMAPEKVVEIQDYFRSLLV